MMDRLILFRFHSNPEICAQRIRILDRMNPDTKIVGLGENIDNLNLLYDAGMQDLYTLDEKDSRWCWLNGDLAMKEWFNKTGYDMNFDMLHLIEWDLILTEPLDEIYNEINGIGLTGKISIEEARRHDWNWVSGSSFHLYEHFCDKIGIESGYACLLPGCCFSREFLEFISDIDYPEVCNDEARIGALAKASNSDVSDTGFYNWDGSTRHLFNCKNSPIEESLIYNSESSAFHPYRSKLNDTERIVSDK